MFNAVIPPLLAYIAYWYTSPEVGAFQRRVRELVVLSEIVTFVGGCTDNVFILYSALGLDSFPAASTATITYLYCRFESSPMFAYEGVFTTVRGFSISTAEELPFILFL